MINLVDQISSVNFGIWHAAIASSASLYTDFGIESWLLAPDSKENPDLKLFPHLKVNRIKGTSAPFAKEFFSEFDPETTIVVSHGCWQYPTRWGSVAKKMGFTWIYTPHGMLEPWSLGQKRLKKSIYFLLIEKPLAQKANFTRAVGQPEALNLERHFKNVVHIPNGIYEKDILIQQKPSEPIAFLFLARLHKKKGIMPLVQAWQKSNASNNQRHKLLIAGTDDGEHQSLQDFLETEKPANIQFLGPQFGEQKINCLEESHFYILPSQSEGFPTSVVEAMGAGLIPIISEGCNFPEAFRNEVAIKTGTLVHEITLAINKALEIPPKERDLYSEKCRKFASEGYLWKEIAKQQVVLYSGNQQLKDQ